jgi:hypothetical protein
MAVVQRSKLQKHYDFDMVIYKNNESPVRNNMTYVETVEIVCKSLIKMPYNAPNPYEYIATRDVLNPGAYYILENNGSIVLIIGDTYYSRNTARTIGAALYYGMNMPGLMDDYVLYIYDKSEQFKRLTKKEAAQKYNATQKIIRFADFNNVRELAEDSVCLIMHLVDVLHASHIRRDLRYTYYVQQMPEITNLRHIGNSKTMSILMDKVAIISLIDEPRCTDSAWY